MPARSRWRRWSSWLPAVAGPGEAGRAPRSPHRPSLVRPRRAGAWTPGLLSPAGLERAGGGARLGPWLAARTGGQGVAAGLRLPQADATLIAPTPASRSRCATGAGVDVVLRRPGTFRARFARPAPGRDACRVTSARRVRPAGAIAGLVERGRGAARAPGRRCCSLQAGCAPRPTTTTVNVPALFTRAVDAAASFALIAAAIAGAMAVVADLLQRAARTRAEGRPDRRLVASGALAGVVALCFVVIRP